MHVNWNISGVFILISHVNSLVGLLSFSEQGHGLEYFVHVNGLVMSLLEEKHLRMKIP